MPAFDRVFAFNPRNIVKELIAIVDIAPTARPRRSVVGVVIRALVPTHTEV